MMPAGIWVLFSLLIPVTIQSQGDKPMKRLVIGLRTEGGKTIKVPSGSCVDVSVVDSSFLDKETALMFKIFRYKQAEMLKQLTLIVNVPNEDTFELSVSVRIHMGQCMTSSLLNGDYLQQTFILLEDERQIYNTQLYLKRQKHGPSVGRCTFVSCVYNGVCAMAGNSTEFKCRCPHCSKVYNPVCASDRKTYKSECEMKRASCLSNTNLFALFRGVCDDYTILKGKVNRNAGNQVTYVSPPCHVIKLETRTTDLNSTDSEFSNLQRGGLGALSSDYTLLMPKHNSSNVTLLANAGSCPNHFVQVPQPNEDGYILRRNYTNGKNLTVYLFEGCRCSYGSLCVYRPEIDKLVCACPVGCQNNTEPVCGSDDVTYQNECIMKSENCLRRRTVQLMHSGKCHAQCKAIKCRFGNCVRLANGSEACQCSHKCSQLLPRWLCASNGKSYANDCERRRDMCLKNIYIAVEHPGRCERGRQSIIGTIYPTRRVTASPEHILECIVIKKRTKELAGPNRLGRDQLLSVMNQFLSNLDFSFNQNISSGLTGLTKNFQELLSVRSELDITMDDLQNPKSVAKALAVFSSLVKNNKMMKQDNFVSAFGNCSNVEGNEDSYNISHFALPGIGNLIGTLYETKCGKICTNYSTCRMSKDGRASCVCQLDCPEYLDPVCASNQITYDNLCVMKRESCRMKTMLAVQHKGKCPHTLTVSGMIDKSRKNYILQSLLSKSCLTVEVKASLRGSTVLLGTKTITVIADEEYVPYQYNITALYSSQGISQVTIHAVLHVNHCSRQIKYGDFVNDTTLPVNFSDGKLAFTVNMTLVKYVEAVCKSINCQNNAMCLEKDGKATCACVLNCPLNYKPVCGSDGKTYDNICEMKAKSCTEAKMLTVAYNGECLKSCTTKLGFDIRHGDIVKFNGVGCHDCLCQNGQIQCPAIHCREHIQCTNGMLQIKEGDCCPTCVKRSRCLVSGKYYNSGDEFYADQSASYCNLCVCLANGEVSCRLKICPIMPCRKPIIIGRSCCPVCPKQIGCKQPKTGELYKAGESWRNGQNGCTKCTCIRISSTTSRIICRQPKCPQLNCKLLVYLKGSCCPVCYDKNPKGPTTLKLRNEKQRSIINWQTSCTPRASDLVYAEGETWKRGCSNYNCTSFGILAKPVRCPLLTCRKAEQITKPNSCCPVCRSKSALKLSCSGTGMLLSVRKTFLPYISSSQLIFDKTECSATDNGTHFILKTGYQSCGTRRLSRNGVFEYRNLALTIDKPNAVIALRKPIKIPIVCLVRKRIKVMFSRGFKLADDVKSVEELEVSSSGPDASLRLKMHVTSENGGGKAHPGPRITVGAGEKVFVEIVKVGKQVDDWLVIAERCSIAAEANKDNIISLIENGCPVDPTVQFYTDQRNGAKFSFVAPSFRTLRGRGFVLNCEATACHASEMFSICRAPCNKSRRKRGTKSFAKRFHFSKFIAYSYF